MNDLLAKAQAAPAGDKCNYDVLLAPATTLRAKGWSFRAMHEWFAAEGVRVPKNYITFASALSKRIRNQNKRNQ